MTPAKTWPDILSHGSNMTTVWARPICHVFFHSPILMGIHFRSDCLRNYYVLTPFGARFWISYCASYHVRCTQTTSGRGSKAASASCASCRRSDTWPGRWWHLDKKPVMLGWASWFWTFFLRLNMKNVGSTKIFDLFSLVGFRKMLPFMASLQSRMPF